MNKASGFLIFLFLSTCNWTYSQVVSSNAIPYIQHYNDKDYQTRENQTWAIQEDKRGIMYFGNNAGLLEFDGTYWRIINIPNKSVLRSIAMDKTGKIYIGAESEFGYLKADSNETLQFYSLIHLVPEEYNNFEDVWQIFIINDQVIFRTTSYIFLLKEDTIKVLIPEYRFHLSFKINNRFYVRERRKGLFYLENDSLIFIENSHIFANLRIYVMLPYDDDEFLIITRENGFYIYNPSKQNSFTKPEKLKYLDDFIIKSQIYCGDTLGKNQFVLGTIQNGLIFMDNNGNITRHLNPETGLNNNTVYCIYINKENNIWTGLNSGISYIPLNSQFKLLSEKNGLKGAVYYTTTFNNHIYTGNSLGVFYEYEKNKFTKVKNSEGQSWFLTEINNNLYCANFEGLLKISKDIATNILPIGNIWKIIELNNYPDRYIIGTDEGLALCELINDEIVFKNKIEGYDATARYFFEDSSGNIWISNANLGIYKLTLNKQLNQITNIELFTKEDGLPSSTNNYVFKIRSPEGRTRIIFGTENGIYKYDVLQNNFIPVEEFNHLLRAQGEIYSFEQDKNGNIYYQQGEEKGLLLLQSNDTYKLLRTPFLKLDGLFAENIAIIDSATVLFSNKDGIVQYNNLTEYNYYKSFPLLIRKVLVKDSIIYGGAHQQNEIVYLPYKKNDIQFQYSALFYENNDKTQYSYYLKGYDPENKWSLWSLKTEKEYTNLPEGSYTYMVKARNVFKVESTITKFQFQILSPWYRTLLAYISYSILVVLLVISIVNFYTRKLKLDKIKLEKIITERTHEISTKSNEILIQNSEILQQKEEIQTQAENLATINIELEKLSIVASKTENAVLILDANGTIEWINEGYSRLMGYSLDELNKERGNSLLELSSNRDMEEILKTIKITKKPFTYQSVNKTRSGVKIWFQTNITPIVNESNEVIKLILIDTDITKLKNAEREIIDSIIYAKRIQNAILPPKDNILKNHVDHFIFYRPRDIVSGDFYWFRKIEDIFIIIVADCTGHGVPGAFLSMLGIALLNEIIRRKEITLPSLALNAMREDLKIALHQSGKEHEADDGINIGMVALNLKNMEVDFAGAYNPLYLIRNNELVKYKADKMPIGIHYQEKESFTNHKIKLLPGDIFYLFTDGYIDQFGGTENRKFTSSRFRKLLLEIHKLKIDDQNRMITENFDNWMGKEEQVDDVTVIGFKI